MTSIQTLQDQIASVKSSIASVQSDINEKQTAIDNFEYECSEDDFDYYLNKVHGDVNIGYLTFSPSEILKNLDPTAYRCSKIEYESNYDLDDCEEYNDLVSKLEDLQSKLEDLQSELEDLEEELEDLESNLED